MLNRITDRSNIIGFGGDYEPMRATYVIFFFLCI